MQEEMMSNNTVVPLQGKGAVVTGASSGHGRAIALALAASGAAVVCSDIRKNALAGGFEPDLDIDTDDLIRQRGGKAEYIQADVTRADDHDAAVRAAVEAFGTLDIYVNNAGAFLGNYSVIDEPRETWDKTFEINVTGTWLGCKAAVRQMVAQELRGRARGKIVNVGSIAGDIGQADLASYSASKGAIHNLTRALAIENAPHRINVNAVAPGYFPTAMNRAAFDDPETLAKIQALHPWPELGVPEDVAAAVTFLASPGADWITGVILPVDGGFLAS
jgi:NAD(P)-dependent dehydrogenase (short-subunit alcohol dehydrogenase family)